MNFVVKAISFVVCYLWNVLVSFDCIFLSKWLVLFKYMVLKLFDFEMFW